MQRRAYAIPQCPSSVRLNVSNSISILVGISDQVKQCSQLPFSRFEVCNLQTIAATIILLGTLIHPYDCGSCITQLYDLDLYVTAD